MTQCFLKYLPVLLALTSRLHFCLFFGVLDLIVGLVIGGAKSTKGEVVIGLSECSL